jgi:hypothetical protein
VALARRYQPTLVVSAFDRFWPVSLSAMLKLRWHGHSTCVYVEDRCRITDPRPEELTGGKRSDYLQYPTPLDDVRASFLGAAAELGVPASVLATFTHRPAGVDPFASAQMYFYRLAVTSPSSYPGAPGGLISLQYWFFYPLNYFPLVRIPLEALTHPISSTVGNTDYHQGDLEHVAVLLDPATLRPLYLWMARHADEGELYRWGSRSVQWDDGHPVIYAALGSHASYAHCGIQRRPRTYWFLNDYVVCLPHETFGFTWRTTPLVDLAHVAWGCWRGHLGEDGPRLVRSVYGFVPFETGGPISPLLQQENFRHSPCRVPAGAPPPAPLL